MYRSVPMYLSYIGNFITLLLIKTTPRLTVVISPVTAIKRRKNPAIRFLRKPRPAGHRKGLPGSNRLYACNIAFRYR